MSIIKVVVDRDSIIIGIVKQLRFNIEQVKALEKEMRNIVDSLGYNLETMSGIGLVTAAEKESEGKRNKSYKRKFKKCNLFKDKKYLP